MRNLSLALLVLFLTACATGGAGSAGSPADKAAQIVYQAQSDYNVGLTIAVAYKNLPDCAVPNHPVICSQASVIKQLQDADDIAWPSLQAAQNTVRTPNAGANAQTMAVAAQEAVTALTTITSKLTVK